MRATSIIVFTILLSPFLGLIVSASGSNTDFSSAENIPSDNELRRTIGEEKLYFSVHVKEFTIISFEFGDPNQYFFEWCIYDGPDDSQVVDCYSGEDQFFIDIEAGVEYYYVTIDCGECRHAGDDETTFTISASYEEYEEASVSVNFEVRIVIILAIAAISLITYSILRKNHNMSSDSSTVENVEQETMAIGSDVLEVTSDGGSSSLEMQDSVIAGDSLIGSTKIENQTINDPEAIARAAIEAYRIAKNED